MAAEKIEIDYVQGQHELAEPPLMSVIIPQAFHLELNGLSPFQGVDYIPPQDVRQWFAEHPIQP